MDKCFICEKHEGKNDAAKFHIFSTSLVHVYHMYPKDERVYLGHVFIEADRHIPGLAEMTLDEAHEIGRFQKIISKAFKDFFGAEHVYSFVLGDGIPHLHVHLIPRYKGSPDEFRGFKVGEWQDAPHGNEEETIEFCHQLKEKIIEVESGLI